MLPMSKKSELCSDNQDRNFMIRKLLFTGVIGCINLIPIIAQQQQMLTIDEIFNLADANSKSLKVHDLTVAEATHLSMIEGAFLKYFGVHRDRETV